MFIDGQMKRALSIVSSGIIAIVILLCVFFRPYVEVWLSYVSQQVTGPKTVEQRLAQYGPAARARIKPDFKRAGVSYPPKRLVLLGLKTERLLEVYAADEANGFRCIRWYRIQAASGEVGPKLREGDRQVPEGIYTIESLNSNSRYHLALRVGYPNAFDKEQAKKDGRTFLGGDIMIHGNSLSVGCLAMGDEASEDLFVLAADTGLQNITVVLSPVDFRTVKTFPFGPKIPAWANSVYQTIKEWLVQLPIPAILVQLPKKQV